MSRNRQIGLAVWLAFLAGCLLRFLPGLLTGFPVNDGGMLVAMSRDLLSNGFMLPVATSYNYSNIPFAYPPLGMYVAASLHRLFAASEIEIFRWLPPLIASVAILVFYWLAQEIFASKTKAILAVFLYALMPGVSDWLVMGGGLTRSLGILFSLLAIGYTYRLFRSDNPQRLAGQVILFASLTVLSHPEVGLQTAAICFMLWALHGRSSSGIKYALLVALGVALLTSVWWGTVLRYHGLSPFQSAIQTGIHETLVASLFHTFFSMQGALPVLPVFGLIGLFAVLRSREVLLVLWAFLPFFVDPRNAPAIAIFPFLMLASEGLYFLHTELTRVYAKTFSRNQHAGKYLPIVTQGSFACILLYLFLISLTVPSRLVSISLGASDLETMQWIRKNTHPESRFLLMTNTGNISPMTDSYQEWFPAIAQRRSVNTLQGTEWILGSNFFPYSQQLVALQTCRDVDCLNDWLEQNNMQVDFILLRTERANQRLKSSLQLDDHYRTLYCSATAEVFVFHP